jgi:hypothetical protein
LVKDVFPLRVKSVAIGAVAAALALAILYPLSMHVFFDTRDGTSIDGRHWTTVGVLILLIPPGLCVGCPLAFVVRALAPHSPVAAAIAVGLYCVVGGFLNSSSTPRLAEWALGFGIAFVYAALSIGIATGLELARRRRDGRRVAATFE